MFLQRSIFAYLFILIIATIAVVVMSSQEGSSTWLDEIDPTEKELYTLELVVPVSAEDINMTKAMKFYEARATYCDAKENKKQSLLCYKRTMPWWSKIYRDKEQKAR